FAHTVRRVDRLQPALLVICLISTLGFALSADDDARPSALVAAAGFLIILVGSAALLVPIQRRLVSPEPGLSAPDAERLRRLWLQGHVIRTVIAVVALVLIVVAASS